MCVLFVKNKSTTEWQEYGRTEVVKNNNSPVFSKTFILDYRFEERQELKFALYDVDQQNAALSRQDFLGEVITEMAEIMGSRGQKVVKEIMSPKKNGGKLTISGEELKGETNDTVTFQFSGKNLDKKDFLGKSDPFFILSRIRIDDNSYVPVYKSEFIKNTLNCTWKPVTLSVQQLCNGDLERPLKVEVFDHDSDGGHDFIGNCSFSLRWLLDNGAGGAGAGKELISEKKRAKKGSKYTNSGHLVVESAVYKKAYSFLEYIAGGCEVSLFVSIDFTGSNGDPRQPSSLHYLTPQGQNEYEQSIVAVGEILAFYDTDKRFPAYGFGGNLPNIGTSHCFALNGNPNAPEVNGVQGIIQAYRTALFNVGLSGPTNFAPTINMAASMASQFVSQQSQKYFILLILTDGEITDLAETIEAIIRASALPLSIVIVGVGQAGFDMMAELDSDRVKLRGAGGRTAERDIVQFVSFREYGRVQCSALAEAVLGEIPRQFLEYMNAHQIVPNPKLTPLVV